MEKKPVVIIADPESIDFYRALPLWDEHTELYPAAKSPHKGGTLNADLVLIDCGFDDDMGLSLVRDIKLDYPSIPVMLLTDAGSEETAVNAFKFGVSDYIKKPVGMLELRDTVKKFLFVKRTFWGKMHPYIGDRCGNVAKLSRSTQNDLSPNLLRVIRFVKDNLSNDISIDQLAQEAGFSKCHFCRKFKKAIGIPPMQFLSLMRIKRSKEFLRKNLPISTIAMKVGFNDLSTFNKHFKRITGQSPTEYRNSLHKFSWLIAIIFHAAYTLA